MIPISNLPSKAAHKSVFVNMFSFSLHHMCIGCYFRFRIVCTQLSPTLMEKLQVVGGGGIEVCMYGCLYEPCVVCVVLLCITVMVYRCTCTLWGMYCTFIHMYMYMYMYIHCGLLFVFFQLNTKSILAGQ